MAETPEHEHQWGRGIPGDEWQKCIAKDVWCRAHKHRRTGEIRVMRHITCPKLCGLAYYEHEAKDHSCWDA